MSETCIRFCGCSRLIWIHYRGQVMQLGSLGFSDRLNGTALSLNYMPLLNRLCIKTAKTTPHSKSLTRILRAQRLCLFCCLRKFGISAKSEHVSAEFSSSLHQKWNLLQVSRAAPARGCDSNSFLGNWFWNKLGKRLTTHISVSLVWDLCIMMLQGQILG